MPASWRTRRLLPSVIDEASDSSPPEAASLPRAIPDRAIGEARPCHNRAAA